MDVATVEEFTICLAQACQGLRKRGENTLRDDVFCDKHVKGCLRTFWTLLPANITAACQLQPVVCQPQSVVCQPSLPQSIQPKFDRWKASASAFYDQLREYDSSGENALASAFNFLRKVKIDCHINRIRQRVLYVLFSRLKAAFEVRLRDSNLRTLARLIQCSGLVNESLDDIVKILGIWAAKGDRYESISKELGGCGALVLFPDYISDSFWEEELSQTSEHHQQFIALLFEERIHSKASRIKAHKVVEKIINYGFWVSGQQALAQGFSLEIQDNGLGLINILNFNHLSGDEDLQSFYLDRICASRTLLQGTNIYKETLQILNTTQEVRFLRYSLYALSAFCLKRNETNEYREKALQTLRSSIPQAGAMIRQVLAATGLLLHQSILDRDAVDTWSQHVRSLGPLLTYAMKYQKTFRYRMWLAFHGILANAAVSRDLQFPEYRFLTAEEQNSPYIDELTGLSPELLSIIQECNVLAFVDDSKRNSTGFKLHARLRFLTQRYNHSQKDCQSTWIIEQTAECYSPSQSMGNPIGLSFEELGRTQEKLVTILETLPTSGHFYTAIWPLYPLFICSVRPFSRGERARIEGIWAQLYANSARSNVPLATEAIRRIFQVEHSHNSSENVWWESYIQPCGLVSLT